MMREIRGQLAKKEKEKRNTSNQYSGLKKYFEDLDEEDERVENGDWRNLERLLNGFVKK